MNKGLNYLEKLKKQFGNKYDELTSFDENGNIIETKRFTYDKYYFEPIEKELKRLEEQDNILKDYNLSLANFREAFLLFAMLKNEKLNIHDVAKQLKALEIIKNKKVNVGALRMPLNDYNSYRVPEEYKLTQEEYNLLKEVLL